MRDVLKDTEPDGPVFRTADHPQANGRKAQAGEYQYTLSFPLENGQILRVVCGQEGMKNLRTVVIAELADRN